MSSKYSNIIGSNIFQTGSNKLSPLFKKNVWKQYIFGISLLGAIIWRLKWHFKLSFTTFHIKIHCFDGKTFNCSLNNWFLIIIIIIFFFPPNFVLAINVCFAICRLDFFHIVSYRLCAFKFHPAKPNHFLCKSYLPIHCLSCVCISFVTK